MMIICSSTCIQRQCKQRSIFYTLKLAAVLKICIDIDHYILKNQSLNKPVIFSKYALILELYVEQVKRSWSNRQWENKWWTKI